MKNVGFFRKMQRHVDVVVGWSVGFPTDLFLFWRVCLKVYLGGLEDYLLIGRGKVSGWLCEWRRRFGLRRFLVAFLVFSVWVFDTLTASFASWPSLGWLAIVAARVWNTQTVKVRSLDEEWLSFCGCFLLDFSLDFFVWKNWVFFCVFLQSHCRLKHTIIGSAEPSRTLQWCGDDRARSRRAGEH